MDLDDDVVSVGRTFGIMHDVLGGGRMQMMTWEYGGRATAMIVDAFEQTDAPTIQHTRKMKVPDAGFCVAGSSSTV